jgi:hypothetical protein
VVAKRPSTAAQAVVESAPRPGGAAGCRDAQGWWGVAPARRKQLTAWARLLAVVAIALLVVVTRASRLLLRPGAPAAALRRRVAARRRERCEASLVRPMITLLHQEPGLYDHLVPRLKRK